MVSSKSLSFDIHGYRYKSRRLHDKYLYQGEGVVVREGVKVATPQRALADLLYFNPQIYLDDQGAIERLKVRSLQKRMGYRVST